MLAITAEQTGQPLERVERDSLRDKWFTAQEAVAYGLADAVLVEAASLAPSRRAGFGIASMAGAPEVEASAR